MSSTYVTAALRRIVVLRAGRRCEYCRIREEDTFHGCEVDHVVSEKHGGRTEEENLALACAPCNRRKGSDIGSVIPGTEELVRLYNPRTDRWDEHFLLDPLTMAIVPRTVIGTVTVRMLGLNEPDRINERQLLFRAGRYP